LVHSSNRANPHSLQFFTFAIWKWWEASRERRRRERQAERLAQYADAVFEDRTRAALGGEDEEEAAPSRARPRRSRKETQNDQLIAAFSSVLKNESRKTFWVALAQNAIFFILGILVQPIMNKLFP
jgi:hypothetical protein